jgi:hypothetical protein
MSFSATWAAKEGWISESLRDRVHANFRKAGLSLYHPSFTTEKLHYGTTTILQRRDGDLYAALPDQEIGTCRYLMVGDFENRAAMDDSLERALKVHIDLVNERYEGGVGTECFITEGFDKKGTGCSCCKLELGTWSERMTEMLDGVQASQSYESVGVEHDFMTDLLQDPQGAGARWDNFQFAMYSKRRVWCAPGFYYATEPLLCGGDQRPSALATRDNSGYNSADGHIDSVGNDYHLTDNPSTGGGYNQQTLDRCT